MNIGLNHNPIITPEDLALIKDLGVTHLKFGFKVDNGDTDLLLRQVEGSAEHGLQTIIDLRDDPATRGYDYVTIQTGHTRRWIQANHARGGWTADQTDRRLAAATDPKQVKAVFRALIDQIEIDEGEGAMRLERVIEQINRPAFLDQAQVLTERTAAVVEKCGHVVKDWEIWGEWTCPYVSQGAFADWDYTLHLAASYAGVKQVDPQAQVYTGGGGMNGSINWLRTLLEARPGSRTWFPQGGGHLFDVANWHHYGHTSMPEAATAGELWTLEHQLDAYRNVFGEARRLLDEQGRGQPLASTEWGVPMSADLKPRLLASNVYTFGVWAIPEEVSGEWYDACLGCFAEVGFKVVCIHELRERPGDDREGNFWGAFCGLVDIGGRKRPAFEAVQKWAWEARKGGK